MSAVIYPHPSCLPGKVGPQIVRAAVTPRVFMNLGQVRLDIATREAATWLANCVKLTMGTVPSRRDYLLWDDLSDTEQEFYVEKIEKALQAIFSESE